MSDKKIKKLIYLQAKHLTNAIPYDSMVYIHWDNGTPLVLADKQKGFGVVTVSYTHLTLPTTPYV